MSMIDRWRERVTEDVTDFRKGFAGLPREADAAGVSYADLALQAREDADRQRLGGGLQTGRWSRIIDASGGAWLLRALSHGYLLALGGVAVLPSGSAGWVAVAVSTALFAIARLRPEILFAVPLVVVIAAAAGAAPSALAAGFLVMMFKCATKAQARALAPWLGVAAVATIAVGPAFVFDSATFLSERDWSLAVGFGEALRAILLLGLIGLTSTRGRDAEERLRKIISLETEREEVARKAVADERARIARELHDVVAHHVSLMVVQADGASSVLSKKPAAVADALGVIAATGRAALTELRRMLGVLRSGDHEESAAVEPQPGLHELERLADDFRSAGLQVSVRYEGEIRSLPAGLDLTAYRIAQEALTNVLKHSTSEAAMVWVRFSGDAVDIEIVNEGRGARTRSTEADGAGVGLIGMQERVTVFGGRLEAGPTEDGGFRVRASLPTSEVVAA